MSLALFVAAPRRRPGVVAAVAAAARVVLWEAARVRARAKIEIARDRGERRHRRRFGGVRANEVVVRGRRRWGVRGIRRAFVTVVAVACATQPSEQQDCGDPPDRHGKGTAFDMHPLCDRRPRARHGSRELPAPRTDV